MIVVFSKEIIAGISQYKKSLSKYPISKEHRKNKVKSMRNFLNNELPKYALSCRICTYKTLGQEFDKNGNVLFSNLKIIEYKDKSNRPWYFSFIVSDDKNMVFILNMKFCDFLIENKLEFIPLFDEFYSMR